MTQPAHSMARTIGPTFSVQLNTLTKYPSILTLHTLGERGRLTEAFTTPAVFEKQLTATEKIDGTSTRILVFADGSYVIGSRENLLTASGDLFYDPAVGIVEGLRKLVIPHYQNARGHLPSLAYGRGTSKPAALTVIFGEFYGGKVAANSKQYGSVDQIGFRVFDVAIFTDVDTLTAQLQENARDLSTWRERESATGIVYGQNFLPADELSTFLSETGLPGVPSLGICTVNPVTTTHESTLAWLREHLPATKAGLEEKTSGRAEGVILRSDDRSVIVKVRFEDYERTLKPTR